MKEVKINSYFLEKAIDTSKLKKVIKSMNGEIIINNSYTMGCLINHQKQIDELTKQVNHLRINQVVRPDKKIKKPKVIK